MSRKYVLSVTDFRRHIHLHKSRVTALSLALYDAGFARYGTLRRDTLERYLWLHDQAKLSGKFFFRLYKHYGENLQNSQNKDLQNLIRDVNQFDSEINRVFIADTPTNVFLLTEIVRIADLVDRGLDPVAAEEFGRSLKPASEFLKPIVEVELARFLESRYTQIVSGLEFKKSTAAHDDEGSESAA